ncbi:hypothetical protein RHMOL_Rhmol02G0105100 [Rhododendron molle]|uniref:Uncharacterized protein n=1 Tax=Rhododendron molle TaxID=49168 RepID=A0ACC0PP07_RHOML|nr:hypothetical protein RHMOL_Rhmol02G0105100 [Rhododendron molle]
MIMEEISAGQLAGAVFYRVYDLLKSTYLHSPKGRKRIQYMKEQGQELSALDQLELGPVRTLLHGAISVNGSKIALGQSLRTCYNR